MSWTAEQERQFLGMQAQREEVMSMHRAGLQMALKEHGMNPETIHILPFLEDNADSIIKALEPFAALKEQK